MKTQTFLIRCEYPDGDHIPTQEFVENIQEYFAANIMDGERGRLVVKPVYQPKEEGLVKEETKPNVIEEAKTYWDSIKDAWICPDGYLFKDENGNVINATKIVLEKKKREYPKTYEECCQVLGHVTIDEVRGYKAKLLDNLQMLLICRDAYWKIAGEEMGLGKPWEPENPTKHYIFTIETCGDDIIKNAITSKWINRIFVFPTEEMRDAFKENFDPDIEICKELL